MSQPAGPSVKRVSRLVRTFAPALLGTVLLSAPVSAWQETTLRGVVADDVTGLVIPAATVSLVGTSLQGRTGADGLFALTGVPSGAGSIRVQATGYATVVQEFELTPGDGLFIAVDLPSMPTLLRGILVMANAEETDANIARTAADLVAAEVPGLSNNTGIVGLSNTPILLRGVNSIALSSEPVIYLDGVRLRGGRGAAMDVLSKIPAVDVRRIRILRGPASTMVEGSANGVIYVETKAGPGGG
jgi:hypothetical protein